jgi:phosphoribosylglycinamide formyltransferase-1
MKIAIICSAGGSSFFAAYDVAAKACIYSSDNFIVITDRKCGAEKEAVRRGIKLIRVTYQNKTDFSKQIAEELHREGVGQALLFYSRLISRHIYDAVPTFNIHPAALPAFKGMNAVEQAINLGVTFIGATLHEVNEHVDDGRIIGQVISPIAPFLNKAAVERLSYLQKMYLTLVFLDYILIYGIENINKWKTLGRYNNFANPSILSEELISGFYEYKKELNFDWGFE